MQKEIIFFGISLQFKEMNLHWKRVKNKGICYAFIWWYHQQLEKMTNATDPKFFFIMEVK